MKKKLSELKYGDRFFLFPVSPIRKFISLEFIQPEGYLGYWELTTEDSCGCVVKHACTKGELEEIWDVLP